MKKQKIFKTGEFFALVVSVVLTVSACAALPQSAAPSPSRAADDGSSLTLFQETTPVPTQATGNSVPSSVILASSGGITLDEAIAQAAAQMDARLPAKTEVALVSVSSPSVAFSRYVLDGLEAALVGSGKLVVVDRANLDKVREEQGFQMSGDVSDASAKSIGKMVGAGAIVTGSLTNIGTLHRLNLKAIDVEKAVVAVSFPADIINDERVLALLSQSNIAASPTGTASRQSSGSGTAQAPAVPVGQTPHGALYVGEILQGEMGLLDALDWININAKNSGNYTIALGKDEAITPTELDYGGKTVTITLKSAGGVHTVGFVGTNPSYSLFNVKRGVTFTLEDGVTLRGTQNDADKSLVEVTGGRFVMNGGSITGNKKDLIGGGGAGVYVASGSFTMNGGTISDNTGNNGGGVYVKGTFTMNDGTIKENIMNDGGNGHGGGVYVSGTFTMNGGNISGNNAKGGSGGGMYVSGTFTIKGGVISGNTARNGGGVSASTFTMSSGTINGNIAEGGGGGVEANKFTKSGGGGVIYGSNAQDELGNRAGYGDNYGHAVYSGNKKRNTTARAATAMDSTKDGPSGGWE